MLRSFFALVFLGSALFWGNGCATTQTTTSNTSASSNSNSDKSPVLATYGTQKITFEDLQRQIRKSGNTDTTASGYKDFLKRFLHFKLKVAEAERLGLDKDSSIVAEINQYKGQLGRPYLIENEILRPLAQQLYTRQKQAIKVRHILVRAPQGSDTLKAYNKIKAVRDSLIAGHDFEKIALRNSEDESVIENKGELPTITAGKFVQIFEDLAYSTPKGGISAIGRSPEYGYHLLQVLDVLASKLPVRASQIYIRPNTGAPEDTLAAFNTIQDVYKRALAGEDFGTLARQYATDDLLQQNAGDMGFREYGDLLEPFNSKMFDLKNIGDMTLPFRSTYGYHIFKLTERRENQTFEQSYNDLKEQVQNLPISKQREKQLAHRLRKQLNVTFDENLFNGAMQTAPQDSLFLNFGPAGSFRPKYGKKTFATVEGKAVSMNEFADSAMRYRPTPSQYPPSEARRIADELLDEKSMEAYILKLDMMDKKFQKLLTEYKEGVLLFKISEDSLWNKTSRDSVGLKRYFTANQSKYAFPQRQKIYSFYSPADSVLTKVEQLLKAGAKPEVIAGLFKDASKFRMDTVFLSDSTNSIYDQAFSLKPQTWSSPIQYQRGKVILYSDGVVPPRNKTFEEARAEITGEYQKIMETAWMERLSRRYNAKMYPERIPIK